MTTTEMPVKYDKSAGSLTAEKSYRGSCPPEDLSEEYVVAFAVGSVIKQREFIEYFNTSDIKSNIGKLV